MRAASASDQPNPLGGPPNPWRAATQLKHRFDHVYDQPDPRAYFQELGALDYHEVAHAHRISRALLQQLPPRAGRPHVLDVCCSYGMLGLLLRGDVVFDQLADRYRDPAVRSWSWQHLAERDRRAGAHRRDEGPVVHGVDVAPRAVAYAQASGAIAEGFAEDLEAHEPSARLQATLAQVDLIVVAGGVGYVTERTFGRLLQHTAHPPPWIAALVARVYPYDRIAATLADHGLVTERLTTRSFARRRFADAREQASVLAQLADLGIDPTGREADGWYHTELHVSRSTTHARPPLDALLGDLAADPRTEAAT